MGWSSPTSSHRSPRLIASVLCTWRSVRLRFLANSFTMSGGMERSTAILTGNPTSLSSRDSSTAVMKSQASSMVTLTSALRVTRNMYAPTTSRPGNSEEMWFSMMSSSSTYCSPLDEGTRTNLGRTPTGTFTLANSWSLLLSYMRTAIFSELLEMNGNGWLTSSARGVSRGCTLCL